VEHVNGDHPEHCQASVLRPHAPRELYNHPSKAPAPLPDATQMRQSVSMEHLLEQNVQLAGGESAWEDEELQRDMERLVTLQQQQLVLQKQQIDRQMQSYLTERLELLGTPSQGTPSLQAGRSHSVQRIMHSPAPMTHAALNTAAPY
jgi:hypothetical protein